MAEMILAFVIITLGVFVLIVRCLYHNNTKRLAALNFWAYLIVSVLGLSIYKEIYYKISRLDVFCVTTVAPAGVILSLIVYLIEARKEINRIDRERWEGLDSGEITNTDDGALTEN